MDLLLRQRVFLFERAYVAECFLEPLGLLRDRWGGSLAHTCSCMDSHLEHLSLILRAVGSQHLFSDTAVTTRVARSLSPDERRAAVEYGMYLKFRRPIDRYTPSRYEYSYSHLRGDSFGLSRGAFPQT